MKAEHDISQEAFLKGKVTVNIFIEGHNCSLPITCAHQMDPQSSKIFEDEIRKKLGMEE